MEYTQIQVRISKKLRKAYKIFCAKQDSDMSRYTAKMIEDVLRKQND